MTSRNILFAGAAGVFIFAASAVVGGMLTSSPPVRHQPVETSTTKPFQFDEVPFMADDESRSETRQGMSATLEARGWKCPNVYGFKTVENSNKRFIHMLVGCYEKSNGEMLRRGYLATVSAEAAVRITKGEAARASDFFKASPVPTE